MANGLLMVKSNTQLNEEASAKKEKEKLRVKKNMNLSSLAGYVRRCWEEAKQAKRDITREMEEYINQRNGEYSTDKLNKIKMFGGSEIFMRLTDEKSTACKAWLTEIMVQDKPWSIEPTPIPDLPEELQNEIRARAEQELQQDIQAGIVSPADIETRTRELQLEVQDKTYRIARQSEEAIEQRIDDILKDANWNKAFKEVIDDIVDLHVGIMKGPIIRKRKQLVWGKDAKGNFEAQVKDKFRVEFERVSPFDIYPSPTSSDIYDGYLIQRHRLTRSDLVALRDIPGYKDIDKILERSAHGEMMSWLDEDMFDSPDGLSPEKEKDGAYMTPNISATIDALQLWGSISGRMLKEFGVEGIKEETNEYEAEVWLIADTIIKAEINGDPLGRRPYYKASFRERNGSFWGAGLPETISDIQDMCNAAARNLVNNMAYASSPQVGVDISRLAEGENPTGLRPGKIWQFDETMNITSGGRPPLWFFQPKPFVSELMSVYKMFSDEADNKTGIPKYSYGSGGSAGALSTATGMSMMMSNASRGIKQVVSNIDFGIVQEAIQRLYEWFMLYDADSNLPGDIKIVARGSAGLIAKEQQQVRRNEFLNIALQPPVLEIIGQKGLADILRNISKGLDFGPNDVVPSSSEIARLEFKKEMEQQVMMQMAQQQQSMQPAQPNAKPVMPNGAPAGGTDANAFPNMSR